MTKSELMVEAMLLDSALSFNNLKYYTVEELKLLINRLDSSRYTDSYYHVSIHSISNNTYCCRTYKHSLEKIDFCTIYIYRNQFADDPTKAQIRKKAIEEFRASLTHSRLNY